MIGLGGFAGAYGRYRLGTWIYARAGTGFPWGTLAVNTLGSLVLGVLLPLLDLTSSGAWLAVRGFLTVGFLGAFTTFSAFAIDTLMLFERGERARALAFVAASIVLGLFAIFVGLSVGAAIA
jgi:fluoride exporter